MNVVGSKLLFKTKFHADGSLDHLNTWLVSKGFYQEEGIDFFETFNPMDKPVTIRIVLTIATITTLLTTNCK